MKDSQLFTRFSFTFLFFLLHLFHSVLVYIYLSNGFFRTDLSFSRARCFIFILLDLARLKVTRSRLEQFQLEMSFSLACSMIPSRWLVLIFSEYRVEMSFPFFCNFNFTKRKKWKLSEPSNQLSYFRKYCWANASPVSKINVKLVLINNKHTHTKIESVILRYKLSEFKSFIKFG